MKTSIINARVKPEIKGDVEQIKINRGMPFALQLPNDETIEAMQDARNNNDLEPLDTNKIKP